MAKGDINEIYNTKVAREQRVANARKAGKVSARVKKERKTFKEELLMLLEEKDTQKNISVALVLKALDGDIKAFEVLRDTIGEKPTDKIDMNANLSYEETLKKVADTDEY